MVTLPETAMDPKNDALEEDFPFDYRGFLWIFGVHVSFQGVFGVPFPENPYGFENSQLATRPGLENSDASSGCVLAKGEGSILYAHLCILKHNAPWH